MIKEAIVKIVSKEDLTYDEAYTVMNEIMSLSLIHIYHCRQPGNYKSPAYHQSCRRFCKRKRRKSFRHPGHGKSRRRHSRGPA